ncbi:hypothetical protein [Streptomyces hygroscopicus]|uniref:hypothetical protein n=1 Tax=Streptomyces hygroscopicus TaxID=1912 RepID=UPI001FCBB3E4|nr:hypothetical protein [Streptomyces hygroscopicus]
MPHHRADLSSFAASVAARLPGTWTSEYHQHAAYRDQFPLGEEVWDNGLAYWALSEFVLRHHALLNGPAGQQLCVIDRPLHRHQFLVAPLRDENLKPHHFDGVGEPNGIKVASDPLRAAAAVTRRLLPHYRCALLDVRRNAREQPEPPLLHAPPEADQLVTLFWYEDGVLGTPYASVPEEARIHLYAHGFQYHPHRAAFLLPTAYGVEGRALRIQAVAHQLATQGIGLNLRHAAPAANQVPPAPPPTAPATAPGKPRTTARR